MANAADDRLYKYFIESDGESWQSIFPATESEKSQLHTNPDDAFAYMHYECGVPADAIRVVPVDPARLIQS